MITSWATIKGRPTVLITACFMACFLLGQLIEHRSMPGFLREAVAFDRAIELTEEDHDRHAGGLPRLPASCPCWEWWMPRTCTGDLVN